MSPMNVSEHACLEELLSLAGGVLARLDVDERLAQPADQLVARERLRLLDKGCFSNSKSTTVSVQGRCLD